ncbi:MAG: TonB-dependent receptor [Caulobacteraceae bacterium]|nr:TonB-dependent receptor [Caulobacter sp.]
MNHPSGACARTDVTRPQDAANAAARTGSYDNGVTSPSNSAAAVPSPDQTGLTGAQASGAAPTNEVTVTGSRLRNREFTSADPIQVITAEESTLRGFNDTAAIIQNATVAGNGTQINNNFTGFVVNGGPGVNTVGLRGLGTDETLVLLNGKRLGPAGTQGSISSVDLNTIPSTIIDHIDIIKDGSSSIYGSDAVAGIINIVTKQNVSGGDLHVYGKPTVQGGGAVGDIAGDYGKTFSRGYVNGSFDIYRQDSLHLYDRDYLACKQGFAYSQADGSRIDLLNPTTGAVKCLNQLGGLALDANTGYRYLYTPGTAGSGVVGSTNRYAGLTRVNCTIYSNGLCSTSAGATIDVNATRLSRELQPSDANAGYLDTSAVSPVRRYTVTASGGYDVVPKWATVYGDFLYNKRQSNQEGYRQIFPVVYPTNPNNPLLAIRDYSEPVVQTPFGTQQDVDYTRGLVGVRGALPDVLTAKNWRYDISLQFSRSDGSYSTDYIRADRLQAATSAGVGCSTTFRNNVDGSFANTTLMSVLEPGVACMPINWARDTAAAGFSADEKAYLTGQDTGRTIYEQSFVEGDFNGDLFNLPAGAVSADVGFHLRRDRINDVPGAATLANNSWGLAGAQVTRGGQNVYEGFGEVGIPILRDLPFFKKLLLDISGRYSDYELSGSAKTYKANLFWQVTSWLALKYDQGTSFRAPALYELFLANQTGFVGQINVDPCINYGAGGNATLTKNCAAAGVPPDYLGNNPTALVVSGGGGSGLQPETSLSKTAGIVVTPRLFGVNVNAEVDYYQNRISNTITQFGAGNIVNQCYSRADYPNSYCTLFTRDNNPTSPTYLGITSITNNYLNVGQVIDRGIDLTIRTSFHLPYEVTFRFDSQHSWTLQETTELLPGSIQDLNGTIGSPRYLGNYNFRFDWRDWTLNWFVFTVGPESDSKVGSNLTTSFAGTGVAAHYLDKTGFYAISNISVRKILPQGLTLEAGLQNAFDQKPPSYSSTIGFESTLGYAPLTSQYDYFGRAVFVQVDKKF